MGDGMTQQAASKGRFVHSACGYNGPNTMDGRCPDCMARIATGRRRVELASNGTPLDVLTEDDWSTPYGLSKFDTVASEKIHSWTLDSGQDDECGNAVDWFWWAARFNAEPGDENAMGAGVILETVSNGDTVAIRFDSAAEFEAAWFNRQEQWDRYVHQDCADGVECVGCMSCENA